VSRSQLSLQKDRKAQELAWFSGDFEEKKS